MGKPIEDLEVSVFDWPDRFFVECEDNDLEYYQFFSNYDDPWPKAPYLVDLSEYADGWCPCSDFTFNIIPNINEPYARTKCKHLHAAISYRHKFGDQRPIKLPSLLVGKGQPSSLVNDD